MGANTSVASSPAVRTALRRRQFAKLRLGFLAVALAVLTGLMANALNGEVLLARWWGRELKAGDAPWLWLLGCLGTVLLLWLTAKALIDHAEVLLPVHSVEPDGAPHPCQGVMVFLSRPQAKSEFIALGPDEGGGFRYAPDGLQPLDLPAPNGQPAGADYINRAVRWQDACSQQLGRSVVWNWLPLLRALEPHRPELQRVCILASNETQADAPAARAMLRAATGLSDDRITVARAFDIEDFDAAYHTMADVLSQWRKHGIDSSRVMIDITGGSRPGCIAGAMLTLDRDVTFQHLEQHAPHTRVVAYRKRYDLQRKMPST